MLDDDEENKPKCAEGPFIYTNVYLEKALISVRVKTILTPCYFSMFTLL